eukprot:13561132-Alexandrium_andersonii.AAC.1
MLGDTLHPRGARSSVGKHVCLARNPHAHHGGKHELRDSDPGRELLASPPALQDHLSPGHVLVVEGVDLKACLLYTSDAADDM